MNSRVVRKIQSAAVSPQTRRVLTHRLGPATDAVPVFFSDSEYLQLQMLIKAAVPQSTDAVLRIAQQIDARLHAGEGAGWRFASLPPDKNAYRLALACISRQMSALSTEDEPNHLIDWLRQVQSGTFDTMEFPLSLWFEGFKVEVIRFWLADPRTMELFDYDGFADEFAEPQRIDPGVIR